MRKIVSQLAAVGFLGLMTQSSQAAVVTFAQFRNFSANPQIFALNNPNMTGTGNASNDTLGVNTASPPAAVVFTFLAFVPSDLLDQNIRAIVTLSAVNANAASPNSGGSQQRFKNIIETFTAQSGTAAGQTFGGTTVANGTVLLTLNSRIGASVGDLLTGSGNSATLSGADGDQGNDVVFTSFYIPGLATHLQDDYSQGFTSITPGLQRIGTGGAANIGLASFNAAGVGTFDTEATVPEPGMLALLMGMGVSGSVFFTRRRKK